MIKTKMTKIDALKPNVFLHSLLPSEKLDNNGVKNVIHVILTCIIYLNVIEAVCFKILSLVSCC